MSALAANWSQWSAKFAALTRRERVIVAFAVVFGGAFLLYAFAVEPSLLKARAAGQAGVAARTELAEQQAKLALLTAQNADPDAGSRLRLAQIKQELATVGGRLAAFESGMVPPAHAGLSRRPSGAPIDRTARAQDPAGYAGGYAGNYRAGKRQGQGRCGCCPGRR